MLRPVATFSILVFLGGCSGRSDGAKSGNSQASSDSGFAQLQSRGHVAMGVDQYTSFHVFEPLPNGGRISLQRDADDSAGVEQIRSHLRLIAPAFSRGDFALPGFVHDQEVPGTRLMTANRSQIRYTMDTLAGGGQVRLESSDSATVAAIHDFLAFQRADHRSPAHATTP